MEVTARIPTAWRSQTDGLPTVKVEGTTVKEVLNNLTLVYPGLQPKLFDSTGSLLRFTNIFIGDDSIRDRDELDTLLLESDAISFVPATAGG